jgi:hypothetical protein
MFSTVISNWGPPSVAATPEARVHNIQYVVYAAYTFETWQAQSIHVTRCQDVWHVGAQMHSECGRTSGARHAQCDAHTASIG